MRPLKYHSLFDLGNMVTHARWMSQAINSYYCIIVPSLLLRFLAIQPNDHRQGWLRRWYLLNSPFPLIFLHQNI